jgi:hypothetical protein
MSDNLLGKLMAKKGADDEMDPNYKQSKMKVLKDLHDEMSKLMAGDLGGLKKVTVAAPDKQGLQEGLSKAQELMGHGVNLDDDSNPETQDDDHEHEADDSPMMSQGGAVPVNADEDAPSEQDALVHNPDLQHDDGESDDEELEAKIKMLQEKLAKRKK